MYGTCFRILRSVMWRIYRHWKGSPQISSLSGSWKKTKMKTRRFPARTRGMCLLGPRTWQSDTAPSSGGPQERGPGIRMTPRPCWTSRVCVYTSVHREQSGVPLAKPSQTERHRREARRWRSVSDGFAKGKMRIMHMNFTNCWLKFSHIDRKWGIKKVRQKSVKKR